MGLDALFNEGHHCKCHATLILICVCPLRNQRYLKLNLIFI